jgi:hypothetical protein
MKNRKLEKMVLSRETLQNLETDSLREAAAGVITQSPLLTCNRCTHAPITC